MLNMLLNLHEVESLSLVSRALCRASREEAFSVAAHSYVGADSVDTWDVHRKPWAKHWTQKTIRSTSWNRSYAVPSHPPSVTPEVAPLGPEMRRDARRMRPQWYVDGCVVHDLSSILRPGLGEG